MRRFLLLFGFLLFALLTGCGQQSAPNVGGEASAKQVVITLQAADAQLYRIAEPLALAGVPVPTMPFLFASGVAPLDTATWNCDNVTTTGNLSDADDDGIPVNATFNGKCTWSYSGSEGSVSGSWEFQNLNVQDPDDADPTSGVKVSGKVIWSFSAGGSTITWTWNLTRHDFVKQSGSYGFTYEGSWSVATNDGSYTFEYDLTGTWTPNDPSDPWGDGVLNAEGQFNASGPNCASGWHLNVTLSNLDFRGDKIVSGNASFSGTNCDGDSGWIRINWSATQICFTTQDGSFCVNQ